MSKLVDVSIVSPDTTYKSLVAENEKLKKALEIAKDKLGYIAKPEKHCDQEVEKCCCERNSAQIALKEIEDYLR